MTSIAQSILILDFGSQYNQLIARRIREMGVYVEILPFSTSVEDIKALNPKGIIYSGGPSSVYTPNAPLPNSEIIDLGIPILGICYGMQIITRQLGGEIEVAEKQEFGKVIIESNSSDLLFQKIPTKNQVWMSHADHVTKLPNGFRELAKSEGSIAAIANESKQLYCLQFHPEVTHTEYGTQILRNFVFGICVCVKNWFLKNFVEESIQIIRSKVGNSEVILGLSGGVDSSVAAVLIHRAIGDQLTCIFVDTGLLRKDEGDQIMGTYGNHFHINIQRVNAHERFLSKLKGVADPEKKRKIIGNEFIRVFEEKSKKYNNAQFLAQGTIYPDVIESQSIKGPSATIKSHHNVGGLPSDMDFELLEPLRYLFKDEVRKVGLELGIPEEMIFRHPFPGPGLGIRILGEVTPKKVEILQNADDILIQELKKSDLYNTVNQSFAVLLPVKSVGVMGDLRTYEYTVVVRSADTVDFMTATWSRLPYDLLERVSNRIINEVKGINRVVYDISSKPPSTIEWE